MHTQETINQSSDSDRMPSESDFGLTMRFHQKRKKGKFREIDAPQLAGPVADTHAHLSMLNHPDYHLARCAYFGVTFVCSITDPTENDALTYDSYALWQRQAREALCAANLDEYREAVPKLRLACGCHPHNASRYTQEVEDHLLAQLSQPITCGIGEIGLDYHYDFSPREVQREVFKRQINLAHTTRLPIFLHIREAHDEAFSILTEEGFPEAGVLLHCFNLDSETLQPWVDAGCYIAYGGPLTFKKSDYVRDSLRCVPLDRLLTETDSPYMTPEPLRGMECGPEHVIFTADMMARLVTDETLDEAAVLVQLYANALSLQDRPPTPWQLRHQG